MRTLYDEIAAITLAENVMVRSGYAAELSGMKREYPMLLWIPPDPKGFGGREDLLITYHCRFYLMKRDNRNMTDSERDKAWLDMEVKAYSIILKLGESAIVQEISGISGARDKHLLTPDGEMSVKFEFDCKTIICND